MPRRVEVEQEVRHVLVHEPVAVLVAPVPRFNGAGEHVRVVVVAVFGERAAVPVGVRGGGVVGVRGLSGVVARVEAGVAPLSRVRPEGPRDAAAVGVEELVRGAREWLSAGEQE